VAAKIEVIEDEKLKWWWVLCCGWGWKS